MLLTSIERVRMLADDFASVPDERLTMYIEDASLEVSSLSVPEAYQERLARYLTAHLASVSTSQEQVVIREKVDVIETQYSDPAKNTGDFSTRFGREYKRLLDEALELGAPKKSINLMVL